jgi:hypothetical protein
MSAYEGFDLFKTLHKGDRVILDGNTYDVIGVQWSHNPKTMEQYCWAIEIKRPDVSGSYLYLKAEPNYPDWKYINRLQAYADPRLTDCSKPTNDNLDFSILGKTLAKRLEPYRYMIADVTNETNEDAGYWIYLKDGWIDPDFEIHMIHEYTVADVLARLPHIVRCNEHNCRYADHIAITRAATCADQIDAIHHKALTGAFPQLAESAPTMPVKPTLIVPNDSSYAPSPDETLAAMGVKVMRKGKSPVTTYYNGTGVTPHRIVIYRVVKALTITAMESAWGLRYGAISIDGVRRIVKSTLRDNGQWSQWEVF